MSRENPIPMQWRPSRSEHVEPLTLDPGETIDSVQRRCSKIPGFIGMESIGGVASAHFSDVPDDSTRAEFRRLAKGIR